MAFYAIVLMDKDGQILKAMPPGCQFDDIFIHKLANQEQLNPAPHPASSDMGGGFYLHTLWSGSQSSIILPGYLIGIVSDNAENPEIIKKNLRKVANNIMLHFRDDNANIDSYMGQLWGLIQQGQFDAIQLEKPQPKSAPQPVAPTPSPPVAGFVPLGHGPSAQPTAVSESFDDLHALQEETASPMQFLGTNAGSRASQSNTDPFGNSASAIDPFGGSSMKTADPFGASSGSPGASLPKMIADPFGGTNKILPRPISGGSPGHLRPIPIANQNAGGPATSNSLKYNPDLFGRPKVAQSNSANPFAENPFGETDNQAKGGSNSEFDSDPFASSPKPKPEKKKDEFDDDPFK